jgi:anthranilate phosphoribosyltransferase
MSNDLQDMKGFIAKAANGEILSEEDAESAFNIIMSGDATPAQIGGFLMALRVRGESVSEITGAARAMRAKMLHIEAPEDAIDVVGTGGDGSGTYNISTGAAIVVAACGVPVAKHGNRALSSKSGAADTLGALGVNTDADFELVKEAIWDAGIGFLMAPRHHSAMRHVAGPRVELATRTVFNLLGPICNPSAVKRQLTGVFSKDWVEPVAQTLAQLGCEKAWVMHGSDGTDELTTTGPSYVSSLENGQVANFEVNPADAGLPVAKAEDLKGGDADYNANAVHAILNGEKNPYRDVVLYNASAALIVADKAADLKAGVEIAADAIDSGKAKATLAKLVEITNSRNEEEDDD